MFTFGGRNVHNSTGRSQTEIAGFPDFSSLANFFQHFQLFPSDPRFPRMAFAQLYRTEPPYGDFLLLLAARRRLRLPGFRPVLLYAKFLLLLAAFSPTPIFPEIKARLYGLIVLLLEPLSRRERICGNGRFDFI